MTPVSAERGPDATAPSVSVIIATYNWSSALRCAVRSVLGQTFQDFELLVVGDHCTDDSRAVVESFRDARLRWFNLQTNVGSQTGPNNHGLRQARGDWIAYLGHDDVWAPWHLETTLAAARAERAEAAAGGLISYGPPGSNQYLVAGLVAAGGWTDDDFVPPSALVHRRDLIERIGAWRMPDELALPVDCDFFQRVRAAGRLAATGEVSVFKFNASMRRNAYQQRASSEQERCLEGLQEGGRYVAREMARLFTARSSGGGAYRTMMPDASGRRPGELHRANRLAKGVDPRFDASEVRPLEAPARFGLERQPELFEWHRLEGEGASSFRWTSTSPVSTIELPVKPDRPIGIEVHIGAAIRPEFVDSLSLAVEGVRIDTTIRKSGTGWIVSGVMDPQAVRPAAAYLQIQLRGLQCARPVDLGLGPDRRSLGVAVGWVGLAPLAGVVAAT